MKIKQKFNPDKTFFTSDLHLFHKSIIEYTGRPFDDYMQMTEQLIANWNSVVPIDADVFDLGDMMFTGNVELIIKTKNRLNGNIYRCLGNHCQRNKHDRDVIKEIFNGMVYDVLNITIGDTELFLSHYPHCFWPRNAYHIHGHIHSGPNSTSTEIPSFNPYRYDVGVDNNNYKPISFKELMSKFEEQKLYENKS